MQRIFLILFILFTNKILLAQMFRGNAMHQSAVTTTSKLVYDTKDWSFAAGAPVRSTPLVDGNGVYFGTTNGVFFAINKNTGTLIWKFKCNEAINSSAAAQDGKIFFSDNHQTVYALNEMNGKLLWKFNMGNKLAYPWRFDYYYSSPTLYKNKLLIGGDDGYMYMLNQADGKLVWKYDAKAVIRSTPVVNDAQVLFGDVNGLFYSLDFANGKQKWIYRTTADTLNNEDWGFDRKAILSSPVIASDKILFGSREGVLYCIDNNGKFVWKNDHKVSWVISTVAVKDTIVVTGTSDGRFVQAVSLNTGKDCWKFRPNSLFWSSPLIIDDKVYAGSFDGVLYCLDLKTGNRISEFTTGGMIMSSPAWNNNRLYLGCDDGNVYALKGHADYTVSPVNKFVYYDKEVKGYFRNGADLRVKSFLNNCGYKTIDSDSIDSVLADKENAHAVVVLASVYLPASLLKNGKASIVRKFLEGGGTLVMPGMNPAIYQWDATQKRPVGFAMPLADSVFDLNYGPNDTRGMGGQFTSFATEKGLQLNLPAYWGSSLSINAAQVNVILGKTENGDVSAFIKHYNSKGKLVQLWINPDLPTNMDAILKAAEWDIK